LIESKKLRNQRTEEASLFLFIIFLINLSLEKSQKGVRVRGKESEFGKDFKIYLEGVE
jgi:hypothetical protein